MMFKHTPKLWRLAATIWIGLTVLAFSPFTPSDVEAQSKFWSGSEKWKTDFSKKSIKLDEIMSGGPPKDGIPSIDNPIFKPISGIKDLGAMEPVITFVHNRDARAYPLRVLIWHEIVNDVVGGKPVTITYCPLCNSAVVFERTLDGTVLDFGTTGKLRKSDMVMYDRQTESWWQQFLGEAIVGKLTGKILKSLPARLEAYELFTKRYPGGKVLVPNNPGMRNYGRNPYAGYDRASRPFLYRGEMPKGISPMARVVAVKVNGMPRAVAMGLIVRKGKVTIGDVVLEWTKGQNSALDSSRIGKGRDVGNVTARRKTGDGFSDIVYDVTFAFVFNAFHPGTPILKE